MAHDGHCFMRPLVKDGLKNLDDKVHGGKVVIQEKRESGVVRDWSNCCSLSCLPSVILFSSTHIRP